MNHKKHKSDFIDMMVTRGHLNQCTDIDGLDELAASQTIIGYVGFDATASSLTVGNLVPIMMLRRLQQGGHKPIVILGGGTSLVGDPSDKNSERPMITEETIEANMNSQKQIFAKLLKFGDGPTDAVIMNNADWLKSIGYLDFLREIGRLITINRMVSFDFVKRRLENEQPLTFLEFNYMLMQGYDFLHLFKNQNCLLQMGGSDQWGNIINGVELVKKAMGKTVYGLTTPLITTASGEKMGKSAGNAVWLNADMTSPYEFWQFWRNTEDADVGRFMRLFTDIPLDEIAKYEQLEGAEINEAKKALADAATTMIHGAEAAAQARRTAEETFEQGQTSADLPSVTLTLADLPSSTLALPALFVEAGLCKSNGEARRLIKSGGLRLDDDPINDDTATITATAGEQLKLSAGKKRHVLVKFA